MLTIRGSVLLAASVVLVTVGMVLVDGVLTGLGLSGLDVKATEGVNPSEDVTSVKKTVDDNESEMMDLLNDS